jgi:hypothetical protein
MRRVGGRQKRWSQSLRVHNDRALREPRPGLAPEPLAALGQRAFMKMDTLKFSIYGGKYLALLRTYDWCRWMRETINDSISSHLNQWFSDFLTASRKILSIPQDISGAIRAQSLNKICEEP